MNVKERIRRELKIQKSIEGDKCQDELLLKFLDAVKTSMQWNTFVLVKFHQCEDDKLSYQSHRFYYPSKELLNLVDAFKK